MKVEKKITILCTGSLGKTIMCNPIILPSHKQLIFKIESFIELLSSTKDHLLMIENLCGLKAELRKEETLISNLIDKVIDDCHQQDKEFHLTLNIGRMSKVD